MPRRGKSFIHGIHDQPWQQGPPPVLLAEYAEMETQIPVYRDLMEIR